MDFLPFAKRVVFLAVLLTLGIFVFIPDDYRSSTAQLHGDKVAYHIPTEDREIKNEELVNGGLNINGGTVQKHGSDEETEVDTPLKVDDDNNVEKGRAENKPTNTDETVKNGATVVHNDIDKGGDQHTNIAEVEKETSDEKDEHFPPDPAADVDVESRRSLFSEILEAKRGIERHQLVRQFNALPAINAGRYTLEPGYIPIVMLVASRSSYVVPGLEYYRRNKDIAKTLLVISHDGLHQDIFDIIVNIDFCMVKHLIHPGHVDILGPSRHTKLGMRKGPAQMKLHFLFAISQAFAYSNEVTGVSYMEDDFWPTPAFYMTLKQLRELHASLCPELCFAAVAGEHPAAWLPQWGTEKVRLDYPSKMTLTRIVCHANSVTGILFSRHAWGQLQRYSYEFCHIDNTAYDDGIHYLMNRGLIEPSLLNPKAATALHVGMCGGTTFKADLESQVCDVEYNRELFEKTYVEPWLQYLEDENGAEASVWPPLLNVTTEVLDAGVANCRSKYSHNVTYTRTDKNFYGMAVFPWVMSENYYTACEKALLNDGYEEYVLDPPEPSPL